MKQSGLLQRQAKDRERAYLNAQHIERQLMLDTAQVTLHEEFGWGYDKVYRFCEEWMKRREYYTGALDINNTEADVYREHLDRAIRDIVKNRAEFADFNERYPEVKLINGLGKWVDRK